MLRGVGLLDFCDWFPVVGGGCASTAFLNILAGFNLPYAHIHVSKDWFAFINAFTYHNLVIETEGRRCWIAIACTGGVRRHSERKARPKKCK